MAVPLSRRLLYFLFGLGLFVFWGFGSFAFTRRLWQYDIFIETVSWGDFATELAEIGIKLVATGIIWIVGFVLSSVVFHKVVGSDEAKFMREHERRVAQELLAESEALVDAKSESSSSRAVPEGPQGQSEQL